MNKQIRVSLAVCILFFEKVDQTIECIESLVKNDKKTNIYILNNNSSAESRRILKNFCNSYKNIKFFDSLKNLGVAGGRNYLIKNSKEDWLFFLDNDIKISTFDWFGKLVEHINTDGSVEVFMPTLYNAHEFSYVHCPDLKLSGRMIVRIPTLKHKINNFMGGCALVSRRLFDRLGLYDENLFIGWEDWELSIRALVKNVPIIAKKVFDIRCIHSHRQSISNVDKHAALTRYSSETFLSSAQYLMNKLDLNIEVSDSRRWTKRKAMELTTGSPIRHKPIAVVFGILKEIVFYKNAIINFLIK